ncbi:MAG: sulfite exporter TauE/SafE family protein [Candidatus Zhuqueibacterota bacterium]
MPQFFYIFLLFGVGAIAGFLNVMAGGGSTLTLPMLIFMGLDSAMANGTNRIAVFIQNVAAILSFKQEKVFQFRLSLKLAIWTLPGAILGALLAVNISNELFQKLLAIVMVGIMVTIIFPPRQKTNVSAEHLTDHPWLLYPALFGIGFYGGFLQVGVGFIIMAALVHILKLGLVHVNMHKVFIVFFFTLPALFIFMATHNIHWMYGIVLSAGNALGAWWAAKVSVKKGEGVVRGALLIAIFISVLKLLNVF